MGCVALRGANMSAPKPDIIMTIMRRLFWPLYIFALIALCVWILA